MLCFDHLEGRPILTEREQQILELVAIGLSAKEVAQHVSIAPRTVERHIENIRLKMRARNRTHMVTCAVMTGLLTAQVSTPALAAVASDPASTNPPVLLSPDFSAQQTREGGYVVSITAQHLRCVA